MPMLTRKRPVGAAELPVDDAFAVLTRSFESRTVRINLLPPEIGEARRLRSVQAGIAGALLIVSGAVGAFWWDVHGQLADARLDQQTAQDAHDALQRQVVRLAPVDTVFKQVDRANLMLTSAAAGNVDWSKLLDGLSRHLPAHIWLTNANLAQGTAATTTTGATGTTGSTATTGTAAGSTATASSTSPYGTLTLTGGGEVMPDGADLIESLEATPGLTDVFLSNLSSTVTNGGTQVSWAVTVGLTAAALLPTVTSGGSQ